MTELDDHDLLAEFARSGSEAAFATLAARHVNLVYSAALRFTGNPHHAQEITQAVFIILARKARSISRKTVLSGWLYQTARLTAANFVKGEVRRQQREQEAYMQSTLNEPDTAAWEQIAPLLDEAMGRLGEIDRNAVVLRFFENKTAQEVGAALKLTEAAAHKRTARALEKLRAFFTKRGVTLSVTIIAGAVAANSVQAAPVGLATTVAAMAAKGTSISATITALVKGTMKTMTWLKIKFAAGVGAAVLLAGGAVTVAVSQPSKSDDGLTPLEIAKQTQEAYAALTSYSDSGAVVASVAGTTLTNAFHIRLQRPDLYRIDWAQPIAPGVNFSKGVVWSAGDGHFMQMSSSTGDVYPQPKKSTSRQQNLGTAAGVSSSASVTIPGVFFDDQQGSSPFRLAIKGVTKLTKEPDATINGMDCHVFTSKLDPSTLPSGGKLPNNMGSMGTATVTFWIGKRDHLIHQIRQVIDMSNMKMPAMSDEQIRSTLAKTGKPVTDEAVAAMRKTMDEAVKLTKQQAAVGGIVFIETHENIVVNKKFSAADFAGPLPKTSALKHFPRAEWKLAGYAIPQAATVTWIWAMDKGDKATILASLVPEQKPVWEKLLREQPWRPSPFDSFDIVGETNTSDGEISLTLFCTSPGGQKTEDMPMKLQKIGAEWKVAEPPGQKRVSLQK